MIDLQLKGHHAMVCGSTQGIGYAAALELASLGAKITLVARDKSKLESTISKLSKADSQLHDYIVADFLKPDDLEKKIQTYVDQNPGVSILINNTGGPPPGPALSATNDDFLKAFTSHLLCNQALVRSLVPQMKKKSFGRVINIVSTSVREPISGLGVSNTIRASVAGWAKTLSRELAPFGITVNNVLPGATRTQRLESLFETKAKNQNRTPKEIEQEMLKEIPMGRFASPDEIAHLISFLASNSAGYLTGQSIAVDGGRLSSI